MDTSDLPPIEPGDDLDRAIRRAEAEKRSERYWIIGMALGATLAIFGAIWAVSGGPAWALLGGFAVGTGVGIGFGVLARRQLDYDPSGEIAPPPPEGRPPDTFSAPPDSPPSGS